MVLKNRSFLILCFVICLFITGCSLNADSLDNEAIPTIRELREAVEYQNGILQEDKRIYERDNAIDVVHLYVTVLDKKQNKGYSLYDLNHWYDFNDVMSVGPKLDIIVQEGSVSGPEDGLMGYGESKANASIQIRGASTRVAPQKSFKIKLYDSAGLWKGQKTLNLNKHIFEFLRIRNKLSFDYFKLIPDFTSLRTQFVHLHVKDLSFATADAEFEDYGLFTHVEQPNKRFLASRGLDPNGLLYKATMFEFYRYEHELKLSNEASYDAKAFESVLEIKGSNDHRKLLNMLDAVNDFELNINDVIDDYFEKDNYLTWLAVNILMGNSDTNSQNFYLYSPLNSEKFIFMPWDYDGAWGFRDELDSKLKGFTAKWNKGISNYWGVVLHQRFFKDSNNITALNDKIDELEKIINKEQTKLFLDSYYPIVNEFVTTGVDNMYLPFRIEDYDEAYDSLVNIPAKNKEEYVVNLENPMPVYLGDPYLTDDDTYEFMWDASYDLQGDDITYDFQVSQLVDFSSTYLERKDHTNTSINIPVDELEKGENYWRVIIKDSKGHTQEAFDRFEYDDRTIYNGLKEIYIY